MTMKPKFRKEDISGTLTDGTQFVRNWEGQPNVYINGVYKRFPHMGSCPIVFIASGEFREPKAGEYFFSGGPISAWYARQDLITKYWIAIPVVVETTTTHRVVRI